MTNIPDEALEAGARALARYNCEKWDNDPDRWSAYFTDEARAACLAMIEAWPGMEQDQLFHGFTDGTHYFQPRLILPLPTENPDAE